MSNEVKPIVVIYLPENFSIGLSGNAPMELMKSLNGNFGHKDEANVIYTDYFKDYYWFAFYKPEIQAPEFEVFYPKDFTEIDYKSLETLIHTALQQSK